MLPRPGPRVGPVFRAGHGGRGDHWEEGVCEPGQPCGEPAQPPDASWKQVGKSRQRLTISNPAWGPFPGLERGEEVVCLWAPKPTHSHIAVNTV